MGHLATPTFTGPTALCAEGEVASTAAAVASPAAAASAAAAPTACITVSAGWSVTMCGCGELSVSSLSEAGKV